jgi:hypothetical protein
MTKTGSRETRGSLGRLLRAVSSINLNALDVLARQGLAPAKAYVTYTHRLYAGYGLPWPWNNLPWRKDMTLPCAQAHEIFPDIDFTRSPELLHPLPRDLSVQPHELMILCHLVRKLRPARTIELGTAEGRTALNFALHAPEDGEVVTLDLPPVPGVHVGYFYWDSPLKTKIKQIYADVGTWDSTMYRSSAGVVFCDACDQLPGLAQEMAQAFSVVKPGGVVLHHDYGRNEWTTKFWNRVGQQLPLHHIDATTLLCIKVETPELHQRMQEVAARFLNEVT